MADIAREFPLVFIKGKSIPCALLGVMQGVNAYVGMENGEWLAEYVPGRIRAYPFSLVHNPQNPEQFGIAVDIEAPMINTAEGDPLFVGNSPSTTLSNKMSLLKEMQKAEPVTKRIVQLIRDADLMTDQVIRVKIQGKEDSQLTGLQVINEKKLNQMPHVEFNKLRDSGALPLIYAHLLSLANLRRGPLKGYTPVQTADTLGFVIGDDDMIKFQ